MVGRHQCYLQTCNSMPGQKKNNNNIYASKTKIMELHKRQENGNIVTNNIGEHGQVDEVKH